MTVKIMTFTNEEALKAAQAKFRWTDCAWEEGGFWELHTVFESYSLPLYERWLKTATREQIEFCDKAYAYAEEHYDEGGDEIAEAYAPDELVEAFADMDAIKRAVKDRDDNHEWHNLGMFQ